MLPPETRVEEEEDLSNLEEVFSVRCARCGKKLSLLNAGFDENESAICPEGC